MNKLLIFAGVFSLFASSIAYAVQKRASITACSYLDPLIIDILAFSAGIFLALEGITRIVQTPRESWKVQLGRTLRIGFGCAIVTIHLLQAIHK